MYEPEHADLGCFDSHWSLWHSKSKEQLFSQAESRAHSGLLSWHARKELITHALFEILHGSSHSVSFSGGVLSGIC